MLSEISAEAQKAGRNYSMCPNAPLSARNGGIGRPDQSKQRPGQALWAGNVLRDRQ